MLEKLKINTLLRELEFLKSDLNYKTELLTVIDLDFNKSVDLFLENYPDLGRVYKELIPDEVFHEEVESFDIVTSIDDQEYVESSIDVKGKNLYRQIAKLTHPDKVGDTNLKNVYFEAQNAYEKGDTLQLMTICDKLKIPYEVTEDEIESIKYEIDSLRERISFLESTFTFKWLQTPEGKERDKLILNYIGKKLNI